MKTALFVLAFGLILNPCQQKTIREWPRYNFSAWAVACMDDCHIKPGLADVNDIAETWLME